MHTGRGTSGEWSGFSCTSTSVPIGRSKKQSSVALDAAYIVQMKHGGQSAIVSHAKMAEPIQMPFGMWTQMGARNHELHGVQIF